MAKSWRDVVDVDYPKIRPITNRTIAAIEGQRKWLRGSVRLSTGRIVTDDEYRKRERRAFGKRT